MRRLATPGGNAATIGSMTNGTTTTYTAGIIKGFVVVNTPKLLRSYKAGFGTGVHRGNLMLHERIATGCAVSGHRELRMQAQHSHLVRSNAPIER